MCRGRPSKRCCRMRASRSDAKRNELGAVTMSPRLEAFLEMLAAERGAARLTLAAYRNDLIDLSGFLAARGTALEAAEAEVLHDYLSAAGTRRLAPRTVARRLSAIRQFYRFLLTESVRGDDPTSGLDTPRLGRPLPKTLTEDEVARLIATAAAWPEEEGVRLRCLLELLYATGLRVSELVTLPLAAAQRDPRFMLVRGKGGKERVVPLSPPSRKAARRLSRLPAAFSWPKAEGVAIPLSLARSRRPPDSPALRPIAERAGARRQYRSGAPVAACLAPCLRQPSARSRRRSQERAADARPRRHRHHADLHALFRATAGCKPVGRGGPPAMRATEVTAVMPVMRYNCLKFLEVKRWPRQRRVTSLPCPSR